MKLYMKSPLVFLLKIFKWSLVFVFILAIKIAVNSEYQGFILFISECAKMLCIFFPAIYSLAFLSSLSFLMERNNKSYLSIFTILIPLIPIVIFLQPFLYSFTSSLQEYNSSFSQVNSFSINRFMEPHIVLKSLLMELSQVLDDSRQTYFEGYKYHLFFSLSYVLFLLSLSLLTIKVKWKFFSFFIILLFLRVFIYLYCVMNFPSHELFVLTFSTHQLRGIPTYIITIGLSSLLSLYGIISRLKT